MTFNNKEARSSAANEYSIFPFIKARNSFVHSLSQRDLLVQSEWERALEEAKAMLGQYPPHFNPWPGVERVNLKQEEPRQDGEKLSAAQVQQGKANLHYGLALYTRIVFERLQNPTQLFEMFWDEGDGLIVRALGSSSDEAFEALQASNPFVFNALAETKEIIYFFIENYPVIEEIRYVPDHPPPAQLAEQYLLWRVGNRESGDPQKQLIKHTYKHDFNMAGIERVGLSNKFGICPASNAEIFSFVERIALIFSVTRPLVYQRHFQNEAQIEDEWDDS